MQNQSFCYDPDYRRNPKDPKKPYCIRCQQNVNVARAIPVTVNEETWMAAIGHNNDHLVQGASNKVIGNGYIGRDCYAILEKLPVNIKEARSLLK